jgi:hypothetical protein
MKTFIYALKDPNTNKIRYVGKSNNPIKRLYDHIHSCHLTHTHKNNWLQSLLRENKKPTVEILEEVNSSEWQFYEKYWIHKLKNQGEKLTNIDEGGNGLEKHSFNTKEKMKLRHKEFPNYNKCHDKIYLIEKEELYQKYIVENLSINDCKKFFKTSASTILTNLKQYNIEKDKSIWQKQCKNKTPVNGRILERNVVLQYDLEGNLITKHNGIKEAAKSINKNFGSISRCCLGKAKTAYNFIWKYEKDSVNINRCVNNLESQKLKKIYQYDLNGNFIAEYKSLSEANNKTGIKIQMSNKSSGGFIWKYNKIERIDKYKYKQKINPVIQFDLNNNFIAEYESMEQAAKLTNSNSSGIYYCCIGKYKYSNNFIWRNK